MRKRVLFIALLAGLSIYSSAQNSTNPSKQIEPATEAVDSTFNERILTALETIRDLQQEEQTQRMKAVHYRDSLNKTHSSNANSSEYSVMSDVERNTRFNFWANGWNLIGVFALIVAIWSLVIARKTFTAQNATEKHTQNAPKGAQIGVLKDLPRHFYRNLACTCASLLKFRHESNTKNGKRLQYPSEANILKLTTLPDEFILPIDSTDADVYQKMHEEKLLFKNYNMEIEVAAKHFATKGISDSSLKNDYDNLLFKPFYLTSRMFELQDKMSEEDGDLNAEANAPYALYAIVKEHFEKVNYNALIGNKNGEIAILQGILSDEAFTKSIGVIEDSIERSLKSLLKYKKTEKDVISFLSRKRDPDDDNEFDGKGTINREEFVRFFNDKYASEEKMKTRGVDYLAKVMSVVDVGSFCTTFKKAESENIKAFYDVMKPYFDYFHKDKWDVKDLVFTILKVDTALEVSKIGMIDYNIDGQ